MTDDAGRTQDQGRKHRRGGKPSAETASLLAESYAAMRRDLRRVLVHTRGPMPDPGLGLVEAEPVEPSVNELRSWWELGKLLMALLGTEVDDRPPDAAPVEGPTSTRRRRLDFGPDQSSRATSAASSRAR